MKSGACVVCVTSSDDQFKKDWAVELKKAVKLSTKNPYVTEYRRAKGGIIYLACDGKTVNFSIGSTPHPVLHAVLASVCVTAFRCQNTSLFVPSRIISEPFEQDIQGIEKINDPAP